MSQRPRFTKAKILILGASGVGKTAFAVRYLTRRFIGDYEPNKEALYTHRVMMDRDEVSLDILDSESQGDEAKLDSNIKWADGYVLIYSVTDKASFRRAEHLIKHVHVLRNMYDGIPMVLIANKADLGSTGGVPEAEQRQLSRKHDIESYEIAISESPEGAITAMDELLRQIKREFVKSLCGPEKKSTFTNVRRVFKKKMYRSRSDTC